MAPTVEAALRHISDGFDWILLDLMLPDGDGTEVLRAVREQRLSPRVAVATASTDPARLAAVQDLSPDALLYKPVTFAELLNTLTLD